MGRSLASLPGRWAYDQPLFLRERERFPRQHPFELLLLITDQLITDYFCAANHQSLSSFLGLNRVRIVHDVDNLYARNNPIGCIIEIPVRTDHSDSPISHPISISRR
jgi:hypothetical protein